MAARYDSIARETIVSIEGQILTIPDYMTIENVVYYIQEKQLQTAKRLMDEVTMGQTQQPSPLEKAMEHYKHRGWFSNEQS